MRSFKLGSLRKQYTVTSSSERFQTINQSRVRHTYGNSNAAVGASDEKKCLPLASLSFTDIGWPA